VCEVDAIVGAVMKSLEAAGVADNTLVLFTSDNGSPARAGDPHLRGRDWHQLKATIRKFNHNPNAPWRGMKGDIFEGGHRVPYVVRWPGHVPPGTTNDQLVGLIDTMRTIANLVDADLPEGAAPDAVDLTPTWLDSSVQVRQDLVHHSVKGMFAIRSGDWKMIDGVGAGGWTEVPKSPHQPNQQLYNLADDPQETKNLIEHHPKVAAELNARLEKIKAGR